jgi:uncharacterized protein YndB with AHSA1/START domain
MAAEPCRDSVCIAALLETVFDWFIQPVALVGGMGDRAVLGPQPGGEFTLLFANGEAVQGRYLEVDGPGHLVISWARGASDHFPPDASTHDVRFASGGGRDKGVYRGFRSARG